jgi:chromosome segregation ATPase
MPREAQSPAGTGSANQTLKTAVIILSVIGVGLAVGLYKTRNSASDQAEAALKVHGSLSNEVAALRTKLALEHSTGALSQSNLQSVLDRRVGELGVMSNRFHQTTLLLSNAQHESRMAQAELQTKVAEAGALEAQRDELSQRLKSLAALQQEYVETKERLRQTLFERAAMEEALGRERVERADLSRKLEDPAFLRLQVKKAEDQAALDKRVAAAKHIDASDPRLRLDLQPNGIVRPILPGSEQTKQ